MLEAVILVLLPVSSGDSLVHAGALGEDGVQLPADLCGWYGHIHRLCVHATAHHGHLALLWTHPVIQGSGSSCMSVASCQSICLLPIHLSFCCPLGFCSRNSLLSKTDPVSTVKYLAVRVMPDTLLDTVGKETVLTTVSLLLTFRLWAVLGLEAKPWKGVRLVLIHVNMFFCAVPLSLSLSPPLSRLNYALMCVH